MTSIAKFKDYAFAKRFEKGVSDCARGIYWKYCTQNWNNYTQLRLQLSDNLNYYTKMLETNKDEDPDFDLANLYTICFNTYLDLWNYLNKEEENDDN